MFKRVSQEALAAALQATNPPTSPDEGWAPWAAAIFAALAAAPASPSAGVDEVASWLEASGRGALAGAIRDAAAEMVAGYDTENGPTEQQVADAAYESDG